MESGEESWKKYFIPRWRLVETIYCDEIESENDPFKFVIKIFQDRLSKKERYTSSIHRIEPMDLKIPKYQVNEMTDKFEWALYEVMVNDGSVDIGDVFGKTIEETLELTMQKKHEHWK